MQDTPTGKDPIRGFYQRVYGLYRALQTTKAAFAKLTGYQPAKVGVVVEWGEREAEGSPFPELPETITVLGIAAGTDTPLDELLAGLNETYDTQAADRRQRSAGSSGLKLPTPPDPGVVMSRSSSINEPAGTEPQGGSTVTVRQLLQDACAFVDDEDCKDAAFMLVAWADARRRLQARTGGDPNH